MPSAPRNSCLRTVPDAVEPPRSARDDLIELSGRPWPVYIGRAPLVVRRGTVRDLPAVVQMHRRCSARALLDRYRCGGRPPGVAALDVELRSPTNVVVVAADGSVVATGGVRRDPAHHYRSAELSLLVEDRWQRVGLGTELVSHLAGVAQVAGFTELVVYPATAVSVAQRLMIDVGRTRMVPDVHAHLHTQLPDSATLGLGQVRQRLAG